MHGAVHSLHFQHTAASIAQPRSALGKARCTKPIPCHGRSQGLKLHLDLDGAGSVPSGNAPAYEETLKGFIRACAAASSWWSLATA